MELWSELKKTYSAAADKTAEVAGTLTETAKIKYQMTSIRTKIKLAHRKIGEFVYDAHANGNDHVEEIDTLCQNIDEFEKAIKEYSEQLQKLKNNKVCAKCSNITDKEAVFCPKCGERFPIVDDEDNETAADEHTDGNKDSEVS